MIVQNRAFFSTSRRRGQQISHRESKLNKSTILTTSLAFNLKVAYMDPDLIIKECLEAYKDRDGARAT